MRALLLASLSLGLFAVPACPAGEGEGEGEGEGDLCTCDVDADCDGGEVCAASWCDDGACCADTKARSCAAPTKVGETCLFIGWEGGDFYDSIPCGDGLTCPQSVEGDRERFCVPDAPVTCGDDSDCEAGTGCGVYDGAQFCMHPALSGYVCASTTDVTFTRPCDEGLTCVFQDWAGVSLCE